MLTTRTSMKRTGFKRPMLARESLPDRDEALAQRAARAMKMIAPAGAVAAKMALANTTAEPVKKDNPLRSEAYRRLVAQLPCAHCGIEGYSQHAHENLGKGAGIKVDDRRAMPLCCTRPGTVGCHVPFDKYELLPGGREAHREQGRAWAAQTRKQIVATGHWPKKLPPWPE